jgi:glycosyltransferase involved in cell wall biosynthesis
MRIAVIVTTYNRADALMAVCEGYLAQERFDFELLIADDGSTDETKRVIDEYARRAPFPVQHIWQEDKGFRAAAIRNKALAATKCDYVIFTDGDCVPASRFVRRHLELAERGWFSAANRVLLGKDFTRRVLAERLPIHCWDWTNWTAAWLRRDVNRLLPLLDLPDAIRFRKAQPGRWGGIKTCNLGVWRNDVISVNGLDESYSGWGLEDSDLVIRLLRSGIRHKSARFAAPVFHLWHEESDRSRFPENQRRLAEVIQSRRTAALQGIDQYLETQPE